MVFRNFHQILSLSLSAVLLVQGVAAQTNTQDAANNPPPAVAPLSTDQLDSLVAPIALYPDALVAQVLAASCYPEQVAFADDWMGQNQSLQGDALTQAVDQQSWDPSVQALTQFPSVLHDLAKNLSWTSNLGQAFSNQQPDVMAAVQVMRARAQAAGTLQSSSQIRVVRQSAQTIVIEPAATNVVYVPQYNPAVVYGAPLIVPAYTPPVVALTAGLSFGAGVAVGAAFGGGYAGGGWGFGAWGMNWGNGGGNINFNHNTYINKTVINRTNINRTSYNTNNHNNNYNGNRPYGPNGNRPDVPNGGYNGNHGLIGGNGGIEHPYGNSNRPSGFNGKPQGDSANNARGNGFGGNRQGRFGDNQRQSAMDGNGMQARQQAQRGRASMQWPGFQRGNQQRQPRMNQAHFNQPRGGGRR
jgi:hypothetical protein